MIVFHRSSRRWCSLLFLNLEHLFESAWFARLIVLATLALTEIRADHSRLEAFTILLLAKGFLAVTPLEVAFIFVTKG
jgi:hypothetical protein